MRRREFLGVLGGGAIAWPIGAWAQQTSRVRRVGFLTGFSEADQEAQQRIAALREGLQALGWIEDRNLKIERRFGAADADRMRAAAAELVALAPDVLVAGGAAPAL